MKGYNAVDLILKLTGDINPIGDSAYDKKVLNNIKDFVEIVEELISELIEVAIFYNDSSFASVQEVDKYAYKKLKEFKDSINEALEDDGWVMCSERLPEKNKPVIIYVDKKFPELANRQIFEGWMVGNYWTVDYHDIPSEFTERVIAWQPLPEWRG